MFVANNPRVEMGNGHRWRADGRFAINLGVVALVDPGIIAEQPDATDRKSAVAFTFRDAGFLQQRQRAAARTEIDELGRRRVFFSARCIFCLDAPAPVTVGPAERPPPSD